MKRAALISFIVGAALAIVPAAFAVQESDGGGTTTAHVVTIAPTSYQDAIRTYGSTTSQASTTTPLSQLDPAIQAAILRNEDVRGDSSFTGTTDTLGGTGTTATSSDNSLSVDWSAVLPAIALGVLLIAMTATFVTRRRHQHQLSV